MIQPAEELPPLDYHPEFLPRENKRHYISASGQELTSMLETLGLQDLSDLFDHLDPKDRFSGPLPLPEERNYEDTRQELFRLSRKNRPALSFIGDGLPVWEVHPLVPKIAGIRNLSTSYTPYQPERSQGTLITHWIYQCVLSHLTGFEAINSSLYDRASALYEAFCCALRLRRKSDTLLVSEGIYPGDLEVLKTLTGDTEIRVETLPLDPRWGHLDPDSARQRITELGPGLAGFAFPQINQLGVIEPVDALTDACAESGVRSIAIVDPMAIVNGALKPPVAFGAKGTDMVVGEGQHLAIGPNFGGPGLGLFGVRYNRDEKNAIRQSPGRYVGKAEDREGRDCRVMILSTREQHIRKDKATSNICSNQAFLATLAGAATLAKGDRGLASAAESARRKATSAVQSLRRLDGVDLAYPDQPFLYEIALRTKIPPDELIRQAQEEDLLLGVSLRDPEGEPLLKISFSDLHREEHIDRLVGFFEARFQPLDQPSKACPEIPESQLRDKPTGLPDLQPAEVENYYEKLGRLNVGPENACYPLGSCTMKYNPYLNDWAANLRGFTDIHPQAPESHVQGCLEVIYETQEWFKAITGLSAVTTQPVAGAQGELVGIKMFQAYHRARGESHRDVILIPQSAHGTNFATAVMAGYPTRNRNGVRSGIVYLEADASGGIDLNDLDRILEVYRGRVAGIMITNPNTGGIFETHFREIAQKIHDEGGLVYMDGANMNAIAGWVDLGALGVDAVHNNTHKTWTIPHGGGGPGDAFVAVSEKLVSFLPGRQVIRGSDGRYTTEIPPRSIGSFHRHWGNFAHKVRCYAYLLRLGKEGVPRMSATAVLAARYLHHRLKSHFPTLPVGADAIPRMHEFIITLRPEEFDHIEAAGIPKAQAIPRIGKLFLDYGYHAPTVAFPEVFGLMIEPTESYRKDELDRFADTVIEIRRLVLEMPEVLDGVPYFTPIDRVDEVAANRSPVTWEPLHRLPPVHENRVDPLDLLEMPLEQITERIREAAAGSPEPAAVS